MTLTTLNPNLDANLKLVNDANPLDSNQMKLVNDSNLFNSNQIAELTGTYNRIKVSIPRNQMFIVFDTNNSTTKKGFKALIHEHSM